MEMISSTVPVWIRFIQCYDTVSLVTAKASSPLKPVCPFCKDCLREKVKDL